jgi:hypothetical protein
VLTKLFGSLVLAVIVCLELCGLVMAAGGDQASETLKLHYLPRFAWLLAEGAQHRGAITGSGQDPGHARQDVIEDRTA